MLIGKSGAVTPEQAAAVEQHAEEQRVAAAKEAAEVSRISTLSLKNLIGEIDRVIKASSKLGGTGLKICNVDFGPVPENGLDAAKGLCALILLAKDDHSMRITPRGAGHGGGNDPYCLRTSWRPKYGRIRNWPAREAKRIAEAKKAA